MTILRQEKSCGCKILESKNHLDQIWCEEHSKITKSQEQFLNKISTEKIYKEARWEMIGEIERSLPEEGIKWMQEGNNKDRKGFTDGFNAYSSMVKDILKALKE